jgi:carboxymethylenebutenolidase
MHTYLETAIGDVPCYSLEGESDVVLLIFPAVFGIDEDIESLCREIVFAGHSVIAVDPFWEVDSGPLPHTMEGVKRALARKREISLDEGCAFAQACCHAARAFGTTVVALGICFGGYMAFTSLGRRYVDSAVVWHGAGLVRHIEEIPNMEGDLLLHFGTDDALTPKIDREILTELLKEKKNARILEYEGARHGFTHRSGAAFHEGAMNDCLEKLLELLSIETESEGGAVP